jgi:hypothetical protein
MSGLTRLHESTWSCFDLLSQLWVSQMLSWLKVVTKSGASEATYAAFCRSLHGNRMIREVILTFSRFETWKSRQHKRQASFDRIAGSARPRGRHQTPAALLLCDGTTYFPLASTAEDSSMASSSTTTTATYRISPTALICTCRTDILPV